MYKFLSKVTATILILFLLPIVSVLASGKMEVKIGEKVMLQGENVKTGSTYKWIVKKGKEIISTQSSPIFNYTFLQQGEFDVNLTITDSLNNTTNTSIYVLAGDKYSRPSGEDGELIDYDSSPLAISYSTLPHVQSDGAVHLIGDNKVLFNITPTRSDVIEYRIDRNIFEDSNGNGRANDDIDNAGDNSYLLGGFWETQYRVGESTKTVAEITLVTKTGEKTKSQIEIIFDHDPRRDGDPVAKLEVTPEPNPSDQLVYLYDDPSTVGFYSKLSEGKILEFRIDKNIFEDSNGDGNPANDIDNVNDISFKTGDVWQTEYKKTDEQIIAQLIVVGEEGKGSRVQRGIWFSDSPRPPTIIEAKGDIEFVADKGFVLKGDPIVFTVKGLKQALDNYIFSWDFDGDGMVDKEIEAENSTSHIYDYAELYTVKVTVTDTEGISADFALDVLVKDVIGTVSDFEYEIDGNTVQFINQSTVALNLTNNNLDYTWSFGDTDSDNYEEQRNQIGLEDPVYSYVKAGTYIVTLTVVDADQVTDTKTAEVVIGGDLGVSDIADEAQDTVREAGEGSSIIVKILKVLLYLILIVLVLVVFIVGGFLAFLKVQHPDLTFEELIDELKIKILGKLGVHDMIEEEKLEEPAQKEPVVEEPVVEELIEGEVVKEAPASAAQEAGPTPDWMRGASSVEEPIDEPVVEPEQASEEMAADLTEEDEGEDEPPTPPTPPTPPASGDTPSLSDPSGPVPDWLKGA